MTRWAMFTTLCSVFLSDSVQLPFPDCNAVGQDRLNDTPVEDGKDRSSHTCFFEPLVCLLS